MRRERPEDRLNWVLLRLRLVVRAFCAFPIGRFRYVRLQPSKRQIAGDGWWASGPYDGGWGRRASCWQRRPQIAFAVCWSDAAWSSSRCDIARFL